MLRNTLLGTILLGSSALATMGAAPTSKTFTVMTWNLYFGADTAPILSAKTMDELAKRADAAWKNLEATRFKERAAAIADQIAIEQPHMIGLQEVALLRVQSPGDRLRGGMEPAETVVLDFEAILLSELQARGLDYRVVTRVENADVEVPRANATKDDVRLTDHDVILARGDVEADASALGNYQTALSVPFPDGKSNVTVSRGYAIANVRWMGQDANFVTSHLEISSFEAIQKQQAAELMEILGNPSIPTILVGDFNSNADAEGTQKSSYRLITEAGFRDAWTNRVDKQAQGFTCCQTETLANKTSNLSERIDLILTKNAGSWLAQDVDIRVLGAKPENLTKSGLWPSDHAGVVARFTVK
ncbi:MAG TPA: endonuclease/exonuclease/phosphatase family protein [Oligoflexus sp.]|uniref:endonuclease/exonuclease/phosphatase family protein n=1 Tax=Oligoflexus sp. TaxID=1971216 RepID=UPI002D7FAD79|nr:endonuclease/exonuclease/phosphatase family protein [Oligoflexus sp.]HET9236234.1 endonuclease/exonuclease/phosphatase family protein [Oligoflexus sp.]